MAKKINFLFVYALMFFGLVLNISDANSAACAVTKAEWKKNTVRVGESIQMEVTVQNASDCANQNIGVQIFERDVGADDRIAGPIIKTFTGTSRAVLFDYTFTLQDWTEGGSENPGTIYFSALPQNQSNAVYSNNIFFYPAQAAQAGNGGTSITNFNVNLRQGKVFITFLVNIPRPAELKGFCGTDPFWVVRETNPIRLIRNSQFALDKTSYKFDFDEPYQISQSSKTFEGLIVCKTPPETVAQSSSISCNSSGVCTSGQQIPATCNNNGTCDTGESSATCRDCPVTSGSTQNIPFSIPNPLQAENLVELIDVIATWLFNLAIPIAVAMIVYSGVLFLTSKGEPAKVTKAKQILLYTVVGLAIILIGKGFITLIESVLNLGIG